MPYRDIKNDMSIAALGASDGVAKFGGVINLGKSGVRDFLGYTFRHIGVGTPLQVRIVCETSVTSAHASDVFKMELVTDVVSTMNSSDAVHATNATVGTEPAAGATQMQVVAANTDDADGFVVVPGTQFTIADTAGTYTVTEALTLARNQNGIVKFTPGLPDATVTTKALTITSKGRKRTLWSWEGSMAKGDYMLVTVPLDAVSEYLSIYYNPVVDATETFAAGKIVSFIEPHLG